MSCRRPGSAEVAGVKGQMPPAQRGHRLETVGLRMYSGTETDTQTEARRRERGECMGGRAERGGQ
jgi:hypothetical protein